MSNLNFLVHIQSTFEYVFNDKDFKLKLQSSKKIELFLVGTFSGFIKDAPQHETNDDQALDLC